MKYNKNNWKGELEPFFPNDVIDKGIISSIVLGLFFAIAFFLPGLFLPPEMPADSINTPLAVKPEWYFLAAYQTLKLFPTKYFGDAAELLGMGVQMIAITGLFLLPFLDRSPEKSWRRRPTFRMAVYGGLFIFIGLTIWGYLSGKVIWGITF
jgi:ubiquinol-cytochrome c reductase cytochrome b subunit